MAPLVAVPALPAEHPQGRDALFHVALAATPLDVPVVPRYLHG